VPAGRVFVVPSGSVTISSSAMTMEATGRPEQHRGG
jgi:hypothetical protein